MERRIRIALVPGSAAYMPTLQASTLARSESISHREVPTASRQVELLSNIELKILEFMIGYLRENTYQPSIREIGQEFGIRSTKTVSEHLQSIADKGFLERDPSRSRGVKILGIDIGTETVSVPCYDMISDGSDWQEEPEFSISIDRKLGVNERSFFVRARSGDLAFLGVAAGDLVLSTPSTIEDLEDGAIIIAQIGTEPLFYRLIRTQTDLCLEALRPGEGNTVIDNPTNLKVVGRVTGLFLRIDDAGAFNLTPH